MLRGRTGPVKTSCALMREVRGIELARLVNVSGGSGRRRRRDGTGAVAESGADPLAQRPGGLIGPQRLRAHTQAGDETVGATERVGGDAAVAERQRGGRLAV